MLNTQFKKGILEMVVLLIVSKKDIYGYELVQTINQVTQVNEGTIYPLLKRLSNEQFFETYSKDSSEGPTRKYYKMTPKGNKYKEKLWSEYQKFTHNINELLKGIEANDKRNVY